MTRDLKMANILLKAMKAIDVFTPNGKSLYPKITEAYNEIEACLAEDFDIVYGHQFGKHCDWEGIESELGDGNGTGTWCPKCKYSVDALRVGRKRSL